MHLILCLRFFFFFNDTATTEIYTLSLHDALPISTPGERLGTLTVLSLNPSNPLTEERLEAALSLAGQAALAIDRARLYEQQKDFADMMQRSLLPQDQPELEGLEVGHVYASSARVDVGGDVYDFMTLDDG